MYFQQEIFFHLAFIALIALFGYILVPAVGAFYVRHVWRGFRKSLLSAVAMPTLTYADLHGYGEELSGPYRFYGTIRAIQGDDRAWCSNGKLTVTVSFEGKRIYLLSSTYYKNEVFSGRSYPEEPPRRISWKRLGSLPEYTGIFISGMVRHAGREGEFVDSEEAPLLVVIYEQEESALLRQAILRGRQRNEYWNAYTPGSLAVSSFALFLYFYVLMQNPVLQIPAVVALTLSISPLLPILPPAVFFLFFYNHFWKRGRMLRAERDLLRIPTLFFRDSTGVAVRGENEYESSGIYIIQRSTLPSGEVYAMVRVPNRRVARRLFSEADYLHLSLPRGVLGRDFYLFGVENGRGENDGLENITEEAFCSIELAPPEDPAAEGLVIPGNPFVLSTLCQRYAFRSEVLGLSLFVVGLLINGVIAFLILSYLPM